jgi:hypothetical protein
VYFHLGLLYGGLNIYEVQMSENNRHRRMAAQYAERYGVDPEIFTRLVAKESNWNPNAKGAAGEIGYTQIMAETGINPGLGVTPIKDRSDPLDNLRFGAEYLGSLIEYYDGDYNKALMAFNGGLGNVDKGTVSKAAQSYAADLLGGKEVKSASAPAPRTTGLVPQAEDKQGLNALARMAEEMYPEEKLPLRSPPPLSRTGRSGRMSPLSGVGIPGLGRIKQYSTPGGIESLYRKT